MKENENENENENRNRKWIEEEVGGQPPYIAT